MKTITLGKLAQIIGGKIHSGNHQMLVQSVNHGKPKYLESDQVYFYKQSIKHEKQIAAIRRARPKAIVIPYQVSPKLFPTSCALIRVQDSSKAFCQLALWNWRVLHPPAIGITGSAGKSTTTAMVASILKRRWPLVQTRGNLNTFRFLFSYLARLKPHHRVLLLEMGMKSLNNIARQCKIVRPHIGAVTNVGEAHVGSLGNLDIVVKAKQEMVDGVRAGGTLFLNADDARSQKLNTRRFRGRVRTFGIKNRADIQGSHVRYTKKGMAFDARFNGKTYSFFIPTYGIHNVYNALVAIGIAHQFGASISDIQKGLANAQLPKMRLQFLSGRSGRLLINDAWNANPTAMIAGLSVLKNISKNRPTIAVLGDMLELGHLTYSSHQKVGRFVARIRPNQLVTVGNKGKIIAQTAIQAGMDPARVFNYSSIESVTRHLLHRTPSRSIIYFKASRKLHLEKVVKQLR